MKKFAVAMAICALVPVGAVSTANAAPDAKGPACTDIIDGSGIWDGTTVTFRFVLDKPACRNITYTLYASTDPLGTFSSTSTPTTVEVDPVTGDGILVFDLAISDPDPSTACTIVYVYGTTSRGNRIIDRAPDEGYVELPDDPFNCGTPSRQFH